MQQKIPPVVRKLSTQTWTRQLNKCVDEGMSLQAIVDFCREKGFRTSKNSITKYKEFYKGKTTEKANLNIYLNNSKISDLAFNKKKDTPLSKSDKLKSDFEYMDLVIQQGAANLIRKIDEGKEIIKPADVFKAIELKDKLTEGMGLGLTEHGIAYLQEVTEEKYILIINHLFSYIAKSKQQQVLEEIDELERDFYKQTDYYEDYLRSKNYTEKEISDLLYEKATNNTNN